MSDFECEAEKLAAFLDTVKTKGGMGNEAIEVLYQHANRTQNLNMVFVVGDAPPNTKEEVGQKRELSNF